MEKSMIPVKAVLASVLAAGTAIWGWFGWLLLLWVFSMALDYLTGTLAAMKNGEWRSGAAREGLWHKGGMILVVLIAAATDFAMTLLLRSGAINFPFSYCVALSVVAMAWYTLTELGSALENATMLTDRTPKWLTKFLKIAAETVDTTGEQITGGKENDGT